MKNATGAKRLLLFAALACFAAQPALARRTLIRTFVNGNTEPVHDIHVEYTQRIASASYLSFIREGAQRRFNAQEIQRPGAATVTVDFTFPAPVPPGASVTIKAITEVDAGAFGVKSWRWTNAAGNSVTRTVTVGARTHQITDYDARMRGDETPEQLRNLPKQDTISILNKNHHWGTEASHSLQGPPVSLTMDVTRLLDRIPEADRARALAAIQLAVKQWTQCTRFTTFDSVPRGTGGNDNHGEGVEPPVMAPGDKHLGDARGQKFRSLTERECQGIFVKYPNGLDIAVRSEAGQGEPDIRAEWGVPKDFGKAKGAGPSEPSPDDPGRTARGRIYMRPEGDNRTKWHYGEDTDGNGYLTNQDTDTVPEDAYDFYSVFKHELGHVLCFYHTGVNFSEASVRFEEPSLLAPPASSEAEDTAPSSTSYNESEVAERETIYFASNREGGLGGYDIWRAVFDEEEGWLAENLGEGVNTPADEVDPVPASDGATLLFSSNREGGLGGFDLYETVLELESRTWRAPVNLGEPVNSAANESHPSLTADMRSLYFASDREGGMGGIDVWSAERISSFGFGEVYNLGSTVNSPDDDSEPSVSARGELLLFASNRGGGLGGMDVWISSQGAGWQMARNAGAPVNSAANDHAPHMRMDGAFLYFTSDRAGGAGGRDLYETRVRVETPPPPEAGFPVRIALVAVALIALLGLLTWRIVRRRGA